MVKVAPISPEGQQLAQHFADINTLLMTHPELLAALPDDFILVPLPQEEPVAAYALGLVEKPATKPIVYARIDSQGVTFLLSEGPLQVLKAA